MPVYCNIALRAGAQCNNCARCHWRGRGRILLAWQTRRERATGEHMYRRTAQTRIACAGVSRTLVLAAGYASRGIGAKICCCCGLSAMLTRARFMRDAGFTPSIPATILYSILLKQHTCIPARGWRRLSSAMAPSIVAALCRQRGEKAGGGRTALRARLRRTAPWWATSQRYPASAISLALVQARFLTT